MEAEYQRNPPVATDREREEWEEENFADVTRKYPKGDPPST